MYHTPRSRPFSLERACLLGVLLGRQRGEERAERRFAMVTQITGGSILKGGSSAVHRQCPRRDPLFIKSNTLGLRSSEIIVKNENMHEKNMFRL